MAAPHLGIKITTSPVFSSVVKRFSGAGRKLEQDLFIRFKRHGRRLHNIVIDEAPEKTGEFKGKISYRTYQGTSKIGLKISLPLPLGLFIVGGTKEHPIPLVAGGKTLRFYWPKMGRIVFFKSVWHPGTKPNPFLVRGYKRWLPGAQRMMIGLAKDYIVRVSK